MNIGFYYHIPIFQTNGDIKAPSFLGVFLDSLSSNVDKLYLLMHEASSLDEQNACDYILQNKKIVFVSLGPKSPAWHRAIFYKKILKTTLKEHSHLDSLIVRSPSPLSPYFHKFFPKKKIWFMIVGDYSNSIKVNKTKGLRNNIIDNYLKYNNWLFDRQILETKILVNSHELYLKHKNKAPKIFEIRTTTLKESDFYKRIDTCNNKEINLLFTGRIDISKGLTELIEATYLLIKEGYSINCHIVGWEKNNKNQVESFLKDKATEFGILQNLHFHGKKSVGPELNYFYKMADIYVLPSYHEGFPRTIWEAMANSLPVITTPVGSIPFNLTENENVLFVEPKNAKDLKNGIQKIIDNIELRKHLIKNGHLLSKENTLEIQTKKLIEIIRNE